MKKKMLMRLLSIASVLTLLSPTVGLAAETVPQQSKSTEEIHIYASKYITQTIYYSKLKYPSVSSIPKQYYYNNGGYTGWLTLDKVVSDIDAWKATYSGYVYSQW